jgi:alkaline phosphatase D
MKFLLTTLLIGLPIFVGYTQNPIQTIIAFGSCNDETKSQEMWKEILTQKPILWIWGGDNVYADDNEDLSNLKARYEKQKSNPDYQRLLKDCQITGTWDDHDYGINDGGKHFGKKRESKKLLLEFLGMDQQNQVWKHEGVYNSITLGKGGQKIKIINLDTRSFRDTIFKVSYVDSMTSKKITYYKKNETGDILGEEQWQWLESELQNSEAQLHIINSSIQVIPIDHRFEKWGNFPLARHRLLELLKSSKRRVLFISGDRHIAEFSKFALPAVSNPIYEFTSSGMTHTWSKVWEESNRFREGNLVIQRTFGLIRVDWIGNSPRVTMQIKGLGGATYEEKVITY